MRAPVLDAGVVVLGHRLGTAGRLAPLLTDHAAVDLRDPHARELAFAHGHDALFVDGLAHRAGRHAHLGAQRPHAHFGIVAAGHDVDAHHASNRRRAQGFVHAIVRISRSVSPASNSASA